MNASWLKVCMAGVAVLGIAGMLFVSRLNYQMWQRGRGAGRTRHLPHRDGEV